MKQLHGVSNAKQKYYMCNKNNDNDHSVIACLGHKLPKKPNISQIITMDQ